MKTFCFVITTLLFFAMVSCSAGKAKASLQNGIQQFDQGNYDEAIQELTEAISLNPKLAEAYAYRARAYYYIGYPDEGLNDANNAIRIEPQLAMGYLARGNNYYVLGIDDWDNYDLAIADYTEAIRLDPNLVAAYYYRGNLYHQYKSDFDRAITDYSEAIRLDPNYVDAYSNRGDLYRDIKKDYDLAIADYVTVMELTNDSSIGEKIDYAYAQQSRQQQSGARSQQEEEVYVLIDTVKLRSSSGNVYRAPLELITAYVGFVNILNPEKVAYGKKIRILTRKSFMGLYETYGIDEDGRPGGTVFNVVDAVIID